MLYVSIPVRLIAVCYYISLYDLVPALSTCNVQVPLPLGSHCPSITVVCYEHTTIIFTSVWRSIIVSRNWRARMLLPLILPGCFMVPGRTACAGNFRLVISLFRPLRISVPSVFYNGLRTIRSLRVRLRSGWNPCSSGLVSLRIGAWFRILHF